MAKKTGGFSILRNRATLYSVFFLSVVYLFFLLLNFDFPAVFFFGLVGLVTSFFTRNMIIVLFISLVVTIIVKLGGILGDPDIPSLYPPVSESTTTTEIIMFDKDGNIYDINGSDNNINFQSPNFDNVENQHMFHADSMMEPPRVTHSDQNSSIMLTRGSPDFESQPIESIPINMEQIDYGYKLNNPFSKFDQECSVSDIYSCF